jgi:putative nucleotidyltransferase with HDIG domain
VIHRVRQLLRASVEPCAGDFELARSRLAPALVRLFEAQHPRDIVHAADTARWLLHRGHDDADLIAAALLHDVGKGEQRRGDRAAFVLADWAGVSRLAADGRSRFELRRALRRTLDHSRTGAAMLEAAGASLRTVDLTRRHHQSAGTDAVLALLQEADAAS